MSCLHNFRRDKKNILDLCKTHRIAQNDTPIMICHFQNLTIHPFEF